MPKPFVPHRSQAHRVACTHLYRALLKQCNDLSAATASAGVDLPSAALQNLIRWRFFRDRNLRSPTNIKNALTKGHSHLNLLHEVTSGSQPALKQLLGILEKTSQDAEDRAAERALQIERHPLFKITPKFLHDQRQATKANHLPPPDAVGLAAHPLPLSTLKSKSRVVPQFLVGQKNVPFLRYGKQSVYMSRVIRQKMQWKEWAFEQYKRLGALESLASLEDDWDRLITKQMHAEHIHVESTQERSWQEEVQNVAKYITAQLRAKDGKALELGQRMWEIVKQERRLKQWEDLPFNVARSIKNIRKLEVRLFEHTKKHDTMYRFDLRPHTDPVTDQVECKAMGRLDIPVEYAKRSNEEGTAYYKELYQSLYEPRAGRTEGKEKNRRERSSKGETSRGDSGGHYKE